MGAKNEGRKEESKYTSKDQSYCMSKEVDVRGKRDEKKERGKGGKVKWKK